MVAVANAPAPKVSVSVPALEFATEPPVAAIEAVCVPVQALATPVGTAEGDAVGLADAFAEGVGVGKPLDGVGPGTDEELPPEELQPAASARAARRKPPVKANLPCRSFRVDESAITTPRARVR